MIYDDLTEYQRRTLAIICRHSEGNPIIGKNVALQIGLKDRDLGKEGADIRSVINALRVKGYPICGNSEGYFYAQTNTELLRYIESFQGRIDKQQEACNGLKKAFGNVARVFEMAPVDRQPIIAVRKGEPTVWNVQGSNGKRYDVMRMRGVFSCDCEGYKFSFKKTCKHIEKLNQHLRSVQKEINQKAQPSLI